MSEILEITIRSIAISSTAVLTSLAWSIPLSLKMISSDSRITKIFISIANALVGFPTVLVGLLVYTILSRSGPLGFLGILYTPLAIIIGEAILVTPLIISLLYETLNKARQTYWELAISLGADDIQAYYIMLRETIPDIIITALLAFSRAIGELGVALIVGGNIRGYTRVFTTAIALEISKGDFETALSLGLILFTIVSSITIISRLLGARRE
ncbi:MAG: ABC transporter permease [Candidatus Njordarchaeales archaeon]